MLKALEVKSLYIYSKFGFHLQRRSIEEMIE